MAVRRACGFCGGTGRFWQSLDGEPEETQGCPACGGTGLEAPAPTERAGPSLAPSWDAEPEDVGLELGFADLD